MKLDVEIDGGKYRYLMEDDGRSRVLRNGEEWADVTGNKLVFAMAYELHAARENLAELRKAADDLLDFHGLSAPDESALQNACKTLHAAMKKED